MARKVELEIQISPAGEVEFEVKGIKGKGCLDLAKQFEEALGEVTERKRKSEFYQTEKVLQTKRTI